MIPQESSSRLLMHALRPHYDYFITAFDIANEVCFLQALLLWVQMALCSLVHHDAVLEPIIAFAVAEEVRSLQALLLWVQMALFYWYTMTLFWSPATGAVAKTHLRVLMAIKSLYFTFSALQLRNGYPPPASYRYRSASSYPDSAVCSPLQCFCVKAVHSAQSCA